MFRPLNKSTTPDNSSISSKAVPLVSILAGQAPLPSNHEFERLTKYEDGFTERFTISQGKRYNKTGFFNLIPENLPFDHNRVTLKSPINGCDYVNATWLANASEDLTYDELIYTTYLSFKNIKFAIGQDPIPATMQHHFRLIVENQIDLVIRISDKDSPTEFQVGSTLSFNELSLKIRNTSKINDYLVRTKMTVMDLTAAGDQKLHNFVYFDVISCSKDGVTSTADFENLVKSICSIRAELKNESSFLKVFAHDSRGGVQGASAFVVLYRLMQQIDEGVTENGRVKQGAEHLDVFNAVNQLRKERANAIEDFDTYQGLLHCLNYYGLNRSIIVQKPSTKITGTVRRDLDQGEANENSSTNTSTNEENDEIEYVLHDDTNQKDDDIFSGYYHD